MWALKPVKMASEIGAMKTVQDLGVPVNTLYPWISRNKAHGEAAHIGSGNKRQNMENDEIIKLKKRNKELERANEILKETLIFCHQPKEVSKPELFAFIHREAVSQMHKQACAFGE